MLVLGLLAYALWPPIDASPETPRPEQAERAPDGDDPQPPPGEDESANPEEAASLDRRAEQLGESRRSELRELDTVQAPFPHNVRMDDYKASLWSEIQANPPAFETLGDPALDAETAYRMYMYYGMCSVAPRTARQVDQELAEIAERAERTNRRHLGNLERRAEWTADMYELCQAIPAEVDCRMEAILWMTEAVRLGHEIAQVQFYDKVQGFLMRADPWFGGPPLVLERPQLVSEFRMTASQALGRALERGHPEAYLAMSEAVLDGVVFSRDPVAALAYALAAERQAMRSQILLPELPERKQLASQYLDPEQLAEAEQMARDLLNSGDS